ncbi:YebO family protein [Xenorhabdus griffiniae]|uniref:YebO family protein n=1 Tax=Xenorhabdus griffiniae TaxID=351672 RepID=UPI002358DA5C|nr:YebO family protein [Xenorhabdus griffiniae]MDC9605610.1 YebO family protein [Xenorhabdus griffiniae]
MYNSYYDSASSLSGAFFILIIIVLIGLAINFFIIRYASRANELLDVQKKLLQELRIQTALLSGDKGNIEISSIHLDRVRKLQSTDILEMGGPVVRYKVEDIANLYNNLMIEVEAKNLSILSAKKAFQVEIDRISSGLNEPQKTFFLNVYRENIK